MPGLDSPDFPALEVLSDVLTAALRSLRAGAAGQGADDRLLARSAAEGRHRPTRQVAFPADGDAKGRKSGSARSWQRCAKACPPDLVEAAKMQERRQAEFQKNSIDGLASVWSEAVAVYGLRSPDEDLRAHRESHGRRRQSRGARISRSRSRGHRGDGAATAPASRSRRARRLRRPGKHRARRSQGDQAARLGESALDRLSVPASGDHPVVSTLPNGLTLIVQPEDVSDTVTRLWPYQEPAETETPPGKEGLSQVLGNCSTMAPRKLDRIAFQKALDDIGASERRHRFLRQGAGARSRPRRRAACRQRTASGVAGSRRWIS